MNTMSIVFVWTYFNTFIRFVSVSAVSVQYILIPFATTIFCRRQLREGSTGTEPASAQRMERHESALRRRSRSGGCPRLHVRWRHSLLAGRCSAFNRIPHLNYLAWLWSSKCHWLLALETRMVTRIFRRVGYCFKTVKFSRIWNVVKSKQST